MKPLIILVFAAILAAPAMAQDVAVAVQADVLDPMVEAEPAVALEEEDVPDERILREVNGLLVYNAVDVTLDEFLWVYRPIVVFADTAFDPNFIQQIRNIEGDAARFVDRDVVLIIDSDPAANSDPRQQLRPRGFVVAIMDKDGQIGQRRPSARTAREIFALIDRFPLRRQEMMDQFPSGRN